MQKIRNSMKLRTTIKLGTSISILLLCLAMGYYAFIKIDMAERSRDFNLYSLIPDDCEAILESNDINAFLNDYPMLNYSNELDRFHLESDFHYILSQLNEYSMLNGHGLSNRMSHMVMSFHKPSTSTDQVIYLRSGSHDELMIKDMLQEYAPVNFLPKTMEYRGKEIEIFPMGDSEFLASYSGKGFLAMSHQIRLIEKVIDAQLDGTSLAKDDAFEQIIEKKKKKNFFTLYGRGASMPFLHMDATCWSEYDFHMNSDVVYLTGATFMPENASIDLNSIHEKISQMASVNEDSLLISIHKDSTIQVSNQAFEQRENGERALFNECVANLSHDADFTLVTDMQKVVEHPEQYRDYLPSFMLNNAFLFRPFILSAQLTTNNGELSHMWVFTYKD